MRQRSANFVPAPLIADHAEWSSGLGAAGAPFGRDPGDLRWIPRRTLGGT